MEKIRVLLADDHKLVRAGIKSLVESIDGIEVVAEAGDGREALQAIERHAPAVALVDIGMPGLNGIEVVLRAAKEFPRVRVVILSAHANEEYLLQCLRAGAAGYLVKGAEPAELEIALKAVARGEKYFSPAVSQFLTSDNLTRAAKAAGRSTTLTPRQREILQLVAEGHSTKEIAYRLNLSVKTVESHRTEIMQRLNIHDVVGLVRYAIRVGLASPGE